MTEEELKRLRQHHHATIGLFVAFWIFVPLVVLAIEFLDLSESTQDSLIGTLFGAVVVLVALQFRKRCPECGANLGWQRRLGIPRNCQRCGTVLRHD